jgi:sulfatase maturation enzyme AslB (radical SAM superfamily)
MSLQTAKNAVDWIFTHVPDYAGRVEIGFIGGEPLLEFPLIKDVVEYVRRLNVKTPYVFYATTNGTLLTDGMKAWFTAHRHCFRLGLSIDGGKETHDHNRCNSFDKIDIDFFRRTWPEQGIKMTLSVFSLERLAGDIKYLYSLGFKEIGGVNLAEGSFDRDKDEYLHHIIPQLAELVEFYVENDTLIPDMMFDTNLTFCESKQDRKKSCGIGIGTPFFDVDGRRYPCSFVTPMTFPQNELDDILKTDFADDESFIDDDCFRNCYIFPICGCCSGADYMVNKTFKKRNRSKCRMQKLLALFIADMQARRIAKNPARYDDATLYYTIEAIKQIRGRYLGEFTEMFGEPEKTAR